MRSWHLITPEYPPQPGGVSDYTQLVASGLSVKGEEVHVWCPAHPNRERQPGIMVHDEFESFGLRGLWRLNRALESFAGPRRLLVQWVPHGYGWRSMNLAFCLWLWFRVEFRHDQVDLMVHEAFLYFREGTWRQDVAACVHRVMVMVLLSIVTKIWMSIPTWEQVLRPFTFQRKVSFEWLPVPSTISVVGDPAAIQRRREQFTHDGQLLLGHFGTYGKQVTALLEPLLPHIWFEGSPVVLLLMGRGSHAFRESFVARYPHLSSRIRSTGGLDGEALSVTLSACDLLIQPYSDGVSSRRTSVMAGLAHGLPILTTSGHTTESLWKQAEAVAMAPVGDLEALRTIARRLIECREERLRLAQQGRDLYERRFGLAHTVAALRAFYSTNSNGKEPHPVHHS